MNQSIPPATMASLLDHVSTPCPFDYLGLHQHPSGRGFLIRIWQPAALNAEVIEQPSGKSPGKMATLSEGIFELHLPKKREKTNYSIKIFRLDGLEKSFFDPYQFGEYILKQDNIEPLALYRHIGAMLSMSWISKRKASNG